MKSSKWYQSRASICMQNTIRQIFVFQLNLTIKILITKKYRNVMIYV